ncbi:MAG TPA: hypothetical protein VEA38_03040 [Terriglobales bacterium]|nr:hypothetical protein [Terriglobales bacterium]
MRVMASCAVLAAACAHAQVPTAAGPPRPCADELIVAAESYDLDHGAHGHGLSLDGQRCPAGEWSYLVGASTFDVSGSRWSIARAGATVRRPSGRTGWMVATAGRGRNEAGGFDYAKASGGVAARVAERLHVKAEYEWFDVDVNSGHVGRVGAIATLGTSAWIDVTLVRSIAGDLPTRAAVVRLDVGSGATRAFGGVARGRLLPQVSEIALGERVPDVRSLQAFAGIVRRFAWGELIAAIDRTRSGDSRRETYSLGARVTLP